MRTVEYQTYRKLHIGNSVMNITHTYKVFSLISIQSFCCVWVFSIISIQSYKVFSLFVVAFDILLWISLANIKLISWQTACTLAKGFEIIKFAKFCQSDFSPASCLLCSPKTSELVRCWQTPSSARLMRWRYSHGPGPSPPVYAWIIGSYIGVTSGVVREA